MKNKLQRVFSCILLLSLVVVLLFSTSASAVTGAVIDAAYIKELQSVDTQYKNYLDSNVMYQLPSTIKDDEIISVIVKMDDPALLETYDEKSGMSFNEYAATAEAEELRETIAAERRVLFSRLRELGVDYELGTTYDTVLAGYELLIEAQYYDEVCYILGTSARVIVGDVYQVAETKLVENKVNFDDRTGIFDSKNFGYDGSGMVVAVLDTGLDYTHDAFVPSAPWFTSTTLGLTKDEVRAALGDTNASKLIADLTADDVYVNDKVPFAFDYADVDSDVYSLHNNHGTHVSGVIVGHSEVIRGVAPNAQLVSMKIFSDTVDRGARSSWILAALEDCVKLNVDVINMSLGSACGFSHQGEKELISGVYDEIKEKGIGLVVAASNSYTAAQGSEKNGNLGLTSNPDTGTVGSPSTYEGAFSIASISGTKTPYMLYNGKIVYFIEASTAGGKEKNFFEDLLGSKESGEYEYVVIPGVGKPADYTDIEIEGKIALVRRGETTFEEKANAAQKAGAAGVIIYNNTSGDIRMSAGATTIPLCSISQDDGEMLAAQKTGKISISKNNTSGPFMSDFSSWGPTPDLGIKPEITAHGGNILSAVTGNEYDRLSGTSMACPNMAGVVTLLRQYVLSDYPADDIRDGNGGYDYEKVNAVVNRLLMSTADIVYGKNGLPYAVRKQGAGLANLTESAATTALLLTYERGATELGLDNAMGKTKIELGDDPQKTGVYTLTFSIFNFGTTTLTYDVGAIVMTEGVSETPTYAGETVVTNEGYLLNASTSVSCTAGGSVDGTKVTVAAGAVADMRVTITLSDADKKYMNDSFEHGMYVEGFVTLDAVSGTEIDLNAPYLAFYGDWTEAPLFDLDYFETYGDELDDSIATLDKNLPDAFASRPIGGVENDYISYLGAYYFIQNPKDKIIAAEREFIAISNTVGTVHSLRFVWMGMLRNAEKVTVQIVDHATGEVVFETTEYDVRKSYGDGGSYIYPMTVEIEFDAMEHNLKNNTMYDVKLQGYLDYGNGGLETNEKNTFEFPLTTDFTAPVLTDVDYYTEYDRSAKKNRLFAKFAIHDNHYAMAMQVGYLTDSPEGSEYAKTLYGFEQYLTPIYSEKNSTTYVTYELTDYIYDIKEKSDTKNTVTVSVYDFAMNYTVYEVPLPAEYVDFYLEETDVTLNPNEVYTITPLAYPGTEWPELLTYISSNEDVVRVVNNKIVATGSGSAVVTVYDEKSDREVFLNVTVRAPGDDGYRVMTKPVADEFYIKSYETLKAFYHIASEDRKIGEKGQLRPYMDGGLEMYPSESVKLNLHIAAFFPEDIDIVYSSGNPRIVSITEDGVITANEEGYASITVRLKQDGKNTSYSKTISIEVKDPYVTNGPWLMNYFGNGGTVVIPDDLMLTEINQYAFSNYHYIPKDENDEISEEDPDTTKIWYIGDDTITKVVIPEGVEKIGPYAFANLTALETVELPSTLKYIEYGAFYGCSKLTEVKGIENVVTINSSAFYGCDLRGTVALDSAHAINDYAFADNANLQMVQIPETLRSIGQYAFYGCKKMATVEILAEKIKVGQFAFGNCEALTEFTINAAVIPTGCFYGCKNLSTITIGEDVNLIAEYAFTGTKINSFNVLAGNAVFGELTNAPYLVSQDGTTLLLVAPGHSGAFELAGVSVVGDGAFSGNDKLTSVKLPDVTAVGNYAFVDCTKLSSVTFGVLTSIGKYAFANTVLTSAPSFEGLNEIGEYAFAYTDITSVTIPDGVIVGDGAFLECRELASVSIGDNAVIGDYAFMLDRNVAHPRTNATNWKTSYKRVDGVRVYYYEYLSELTSLTIGDNVTLGELAFMGAAKLTTLTLGDNVEIGRQTFFNAVSLTSVVGLDKVQKIGEGAFSGDTLYLFRDNNFQNPYIKDAQYVYEYYTPKFTAIDLTSVTSLGDGAFAFCRALETVTLGDGLTVIPTSAFTFCESLSSINLDKVVEIKDEAFAYSALTSIDLSSVTTIGKYAFVYSEELATVKLGAEAVKILEGAFSYAKKLASVENLKNATDIEAYAFAYTVLSEIDLTGAITVGDHAFMKAEKAPVTLILGENLEELGDNPFAYCELTPFSTVVNETFNGKEYPKTVYTYDVSENVKIIDGSIYRVVPYGLELTTYIPNGTANVTISDETVRVSAYAFAGTNVARVVLPHALNSIGHKAFYDCQALNTVVFQSYEAPVLEEEFDINYYNTAENVFGSGEYPLQDYNGNAINVVGLGISPYYMLDGYAYYYNVFYGANFVDYIGHYEPSLVMVAPSNGLYYDSLVFDQYFNTKVSGAVAADEVTLDAIEAILAMPNPVQLADEALVIAARAAYDKIATTEQKALVDEYYGLLQSAEIRIQAFKNTGSDEPVNPDVPVDPNVPTDDKNGSSVALLVSTIVLGAVVLGGIAFVVVYFFVLKKELTVCGVRFGNAKKSDDEIDA